MYTQGYQNGNGYLRFYTAPSSQPTSQPTKQPSRQPSRQPTAQPSRQPTKQPSRQPSEQPTAQPSRQPTLQPSRQPSEQPTAQPMQHPSSQPTLQPSKRPSTYPSLAPSHQPSCQPSRRPSMQPSQQPTLQPFTRPSTVPSISPFVRPSRQPTNQSISKPSNQPSLQPTAQPSSQPARRPSRVPTRQPSTQPSLRPSNQPSLQPTKQPSVHPTLPTSQPSLQPSHQPSCYPASRPTVELLCPPTSAPSPRSQQSVKSSLQPTIASTLGVNAGLSTSITDNGTFLYYMAAMTGLYAILGFILVRARATNTTLKSLNLARTCFHFAHTGYNTVGEVLYLAMLLTSKRYYKTIGEILLFSRLLNLLPALYALLGVFAVPGWPATARYEGMLDRSDLRRRPVLYFAMTLLTLQDSTSTTYFPWLTSDALKIVRGYPDLHLYQLCVHTKIAITTVMVIIQSVLFAHADKGDLNTYTRALLILHITGTLLTYVLALGYYAQTMYVYGESMKKAEFAAWTNKEEDGGVDIVNVIVASSDSSLSPSPLSDVEPISGRGDTVVSDDNAAPASRSSIVEFMTSPFHFRRQKALLNRPIQPVANTRHHIPLSGQTAGAGTVAVSTIDKACESSFKNAAVMRLGTQEEVSPGSSAEAVSVTGHMSLESDVITSHSNPMLGRGFDRTRSMRAEPSPPVTAGSVTTGSVTAGNGRGDLWNSTGDVDDDNGGDSGGTESRDADGAMRSQVLMARGRNNATIQKGNSPRWASSKTRTGVQSDATEGHAADILTTRKF